MAMAFAAASNRGVEGNETPTSARWARSVFRTLWYDSVRDESIVECYPITGRTHQLRVHLAELGQKPGVFVPV